MLVTRWIIQVEGKLGDRAGKKYYVAIGTGLTEDVSKSYIFTEYALAERKTAYYSPKWYKSISIIPVVIDFTLADKRLDYSFDHPDGPLQVPLI